MSNQVENPPFPPGVSCHVRNLRTSIQNASLKSKLLTRNSTVLVMPYHIVYSIWEQLWYITAHKILKCLYIVFSTVSALIWKATYQLWWSHSSCTFGFIVFTRLCYTQMHTRTPNLTASGTCLSEYYNKDWWTLLTASTYQTLPVQFWLQQFEPKFQRNLEKEHDWKPGLSDLRFVGTLDYPDAISNHS